MTWTVFGVIALGVIIKMLTSPPSALVGWVVGKFALHPNLVVKEVTVTFNGTKLDKDEKLRLTGYFNNAQFLERYSIFPGNENSFLHPETNVIPFVINVKKRNRELNFSVYSDDDHLVVVKQLKKKVACYSIRSVDLQELSILYNLRNKTKEKVTDKLINANN